MEHIGINTNHNISEDMTGCKGQDTTRRRLVSTGIEGYDSGDRKEGSCTSQSVTSGWVWHGKAPSTLNTNLNADKEMDIRVRGNQQDIFRNSPSTSNHRHHSTLVQPTWYQGNQSMSSHPLSVLTIHGLTCVNRFSNYRSSTRSFYGTAITCRHSHNRNRYKASHRYPTQFTSALGKGGNNIALDNQGSKGKHNRGVMDASGSRNAAAIQDLHEAKKGYETRAMTKHKRKVEELENKVKQEEGGRTEEELAAEVNWLQDPGTPAKRATQYVRTRAESWRTKTLIAKAFEAIDKEKDKIITDVNLTEAQMAKILDYNNSLDVRITRVQDAIQVVNRKLTLLCRLLKDTINQGSTQTANANASVQDDNILRDMQARADAHATQMGLDTISLLGKHI